MDDSPDVIYVKYLFCRLANIPCNSWGETMYPLDGNWPSVALLEAPW